MNKGLGVTMPVSNDRVLMQCDATLRQYAAIAAMQGILANPNCMPIREIHFENIAEDALKAADTLLRFESRK